MEANHLTNVEVGTPLRLTVTFDDPSHSRVMLSGKICWVTTQPKRATLGVRFEQLDPHAKQILGFYLL